MAKWRCRCCGETHDELPMHYGADAPAAWYDIPEAERAARTVLTGDQCIIDDQFFFVFGNLELPVRGASELFSWNVWVSLSVGNFGRSIKVWGQPGRESEPPYFGWLNTLLPGYPNTLNLKTNVHMREIGRRPRVELEPTGHPLAVEQRKGITLARVRRIAEQVMHGDPD